MYALAQPPSQPEGTLFSGDALEVLPLLEAESVDLVLTDPPYFLDGLDDAWNPGAVARRTRSQAVGHLPAGMRFDPEAGRRLQAWYGLVAKEVLRLLKPGGFFLSFASPRLAHRMAVAVEDAGFWVRDVFLWVYKEGRAKGFSLERFAPEEDRQALRGWRTPQVRGNYEPILVAQKPPEGTLVQNFLRHGVGLFNFQERLEGGRTPSNVLATDSIENLPPIFLVPKPKKEEKGDYNFHPTVKPLALLRHLIRLTTKEGAVVLDPFLGSGSTAVAALLEGRRYLGVEVNPEYLAVAQRRLAELQHSLETGGA